MTQPEGASSFSEFVRIAGETDERPPFRFAAAARVAFSDTDAQGIVYYGRYAPYFDVARVEYLRYLAIAPHPEATGESGQFVMRRFEIDYHAPATFDDALEVFARVLKVGNSSMTYEYAVTLADSGQLLATATQVMVYVDLAKRRPCRIPDAIRAPIVAFEQLAP